MKLFLGLFSILSVQVVSGQTLPDAKNRIDSIVLSINKDGNLKNHQFNIHGLKKVLHDINYHYNTQKGSIVKISRQFSQANDSIQQTFYLNKGELIYAIERITSHYTIEGQPDSTTWSSECYFNKRRLIFHATQGHGKSELEDWDPEWFMLTALYEAKRDIARRNNKEK